MITAAKKKRKNVTNEGIKTAKANLPAMADPPQKKADNESVI